MFHNECEYARIYMLHWELSFRLCETVSVQVREKWKYNEVITGELENSVERLSAFVLIRICV